MQTSLLGQNSTHILWCGDNMEILPQIKSNLAELVCIDPPYNTGKKRKKDNSSYDDNFESSEAYIEWIRPIIQECYRVLSNNGSILLFCDEHEEYNLWTLLREIFGKDNMVNKIIWHYDWGHREKMRWTPKHDTIFWFAKNRNDYIFNRDESDRIPKKAPNLFGGSSDKLPTDVWWQTVVTATSKESTGYPTQKPLKIIERIIKVHSNINDTVLDCFAGSGTVGKACDNLERNSILIERNQEAIDIIVNRLSDAFDRLKVVEIFSKEQYFILKSLAEGLSEHEISETLGIELSSVSIKKIEAIEKFKQDAKNNLDIKEIITELGIEI